MRKLLVRAGTREETGRIAMLIGYCITSNQNSILIETEDGDIGAMAIYDHWTPNGVEMHAYSLSAKYVLHPDFCRAMFYYPFVQENKSVAIAVTPCNNYASLALSRYLGFVDIARIQDGWEIGTDMVIRELRRSNCRFLEKTDHARAA